MVHIPNPLKCTREMDALHAWELYLNKAVQRSIQNSTPCSLSASPLCQSKPLRLSPGLLIGLPSSTVAHHCLFPTEHGSDLLKCEAEYVIHLLQLLCCLPISFIIKVSICKSRMIFLSDPSPPVWPCSSNTAISFLPASTPFYLLFTLPRI